MTRHARRHEHDANTIAASVLGVVGWLAALALALAWLGGLSSPLN